MCVDDDTDGSMQYRQCDFISYLNASISTSSPLSRLHYLGNASRRQGDGRHLSLLWTRPLRGPGKYKYGGTRTLLLASAPSTSST